MGAYPRTLILMFSNRSISDVAESRFDKDAPTKITSHTIVLDSMSSLYGSTLTRQAIPSRAVEITHQSTFLFSGVARMKRCDVVNDVVQSTRCLTLTSDVLNVTSILSPSSSEPYSSKSLFVDYNALRCLTKRRGRRSVDARDKMPLDLQTGRTIIFTHSRATTAPTRTTGWI